jgi:hypothetical protein
MLHLEFSEGCKNLGALWLRFLHGNGLHNFFGSWGISPRTKCWCFYSETAMDQLVWCWNTRLWKRWWDLCNPLPQRFSLGNWRLQVRITPTTPSLNYWSSFNADLHGHTIACCKLQVASVQRSGILSWLSLNLISILFLQTLRSVHWHVCHTRRSS